MPDRHYYVSIQSGNDNNDGLSAATAWKTLTKAAQSVPTPQTGENIYVHIGPGTYRERFIPLNSGRSATEKIYYCGDPNCKYLTNDTPGIVRITGCNADEYPTAGRVLDWTGKTNIELWNVDVDGSSDGYACYNVPVSKRVRAISACGFYQGTNYNCTAIGGYKGFYSGTNYNCTAIGGDYGFNGGTNYNCTAIGGYYGFYGGTHYNCTAIGGYKGFYIGTNYNCTAIGGNHDFNGGTNYNCTAIGGYYGFYGGTNYNCTTVYCNANNLVAAKHVSPRVSPSIISEYALIFGLQKGAIPHNVNVTTSSTMNLQAERLVAFTPPETGKSFGVQIYVSSKPSTGYVTVELQKYTGAAWETQKSKTIACSNLVASAWNMFEWDTGIGDDQLTPVANTWRWRVTADAGGSSTVLGGPNTTTPATIGHFWPDSIPKEDTLGQRRNYGMPLQGAFDAGAAWLDYAVYQTNAPSIRFDGHGEKILKLPVNANVPVTVKYQVRHSGTASGKEPQLRLRGLDITEQIATHSAGADIWQELSVSATPGVDGLLEVILASRDPTKKAWFSDPVVQ